jgi:hypothetical protein
MYRKCHKAGDVPVAEDAFSHMPPLRKACCRQSRNSGGQYKALLRPYEHQAFLGRRESDCIRAIHRHRYEYGTLRMFSGSKSKPAAGHEDLESVMLNVDQTKAAVSQKVALTMQPLFLIG